MAEILRGSPVADAMCDELSARVQALKEKNISPCLEILRVGADESALSYERGAKRRCDRTGIELRVTQLREDCTQEELLSTIDRINKDSSVHGCLMFRPLPAHLDETEACERLAPQKDVDSMTSASLVKVFTGAGAGYVPCTAQSCIELLNYYGYDIEGKNVAVIGRSLVIGKPVSMLLQQGNATVTMCHSRSERLSELCRAADILITAAGRPGMVDVSYTNPRQVVIDVGINARADGSICGDVDFAEVESAVHAVTPVPGGVGAVTTAVLCKHVIEAAEKAAEI